MVHLLAAYRFRNPLSYRLRDRNLLLRARFPAEAYRTLSFDVGRDRRRAVHQHGFATTVSAQSIGEDCWINQRSRSGACTTAVADHRRPGDDRGGRRRRRTVIGNDVTIGRTPPS
jgi:hypothetical protein